MRPTRIGSFAVAILSSLLLSALAATEQVAARPTPGASVRERAAALHHRSSAHSAVRRALPGAMADGAHEAGATMHASVPDGAGGTYIAWSETGRDAAEMDVFLLRVTNAGAPAPGWPADGVPICTAPGNQFVDFLLPDGAGGAIAVWIDQRSSLQTADMAAQRVDPSGTVLWAADGVPIVTNVQLAMYPEFAPDGTGGVVAAWSVEAVVDPNVYASRLDAAGSVPAGWSTDGTIVCNAPGAQRNVGLTGDGAGGVFVAWRDQRPSNLGGAAYVQHLNANGVAQWAANGLSLGTDFVLDLPALCRDASTGVLVFWADSTDRLVGMRLDASGGNVWANPVPLSDSLHFVVHPHGTPDGAGGAFVMFDDYDAYEIRAQHVADDGTLAWAAGGTTVAVGGSYGTWTREILPGASGDAYFVFDDYRHAATTDATGIAAQHIASDGSPTWSANGDVLIEGPNLTLPWCSVALDGSGSLLATAALIDPSQTHSDVTVSVLAQRIDGTGAPQWTAPGRLVYRDAGEQNRCAVFPTAAGGVIAAYLQRVAQGAQTGRFRVFDANGLVVTASLPFTGDAVQPELTASASDGLGGALVTWVDRDMLTHQSGLYAQRLLANGTLAWASTGVSVSVTDGMQFATTVAPDGSGGLFVVWQHTPEVGPDEVLVQHLNASGAPQWGASGLAVGTTVLARTDPRLAIDGSGGVIVAFVQRDALGQFLVVAQHIDAGGTRLWGTDGWTIATYPTANPVRLENLVAGSSHDAIATLIVEDHREARDLYDDEYDHVVVQRVNAIGVPQWGTQGVAIAQDTLGVVVGTATEPDGSGGAYVAWSSVLDTGSHLFMQRVSSAGTAQWTADGVTMSTADGWQVLGGMTRDPAGDVYVVWADWAKFSLTGYDVYAQRVNAAGAAQWEPNGRSVSTLARGQFSPVIAPFQAASPGRLFVGWGDNRLGDVRYAYVQRLDLSGDPQWTANGLVGTTLSLASCDASADAVRLTWYASNHVVAHVERRSGDEDWRVIGDVSSDGSGWLRFEDRDVAPGETYDYRLSFTEAGGVVLAGPVHVVVPVSLRLAIAGAQPNPAVRDLAIAFTLPTAEPATLELLDLAGRRVASRSLAGATPGAHVLALGRDAFPAGVYFARLTQAGHSVQQRVVVLQ